MAKKDAAAPPKKPNRYSAIIGTIFKNHYKPGKTQFEFSRDEFVEIARSLNIALPKNLGDTIYSFRFRTALPPEIVATASKGMEWGIELAGKGQYRFKLGETRPYSAEARSHRHKDTGRHAGDHHRLCANARAVPPREGSL